MYKIPESFDFSHFKGKTLSQISFGLNVIIIFFSPDVYIQWSGRFNVVREKVKSNFDEVYPVTNDFGLLNFLEKKVETIYTDECRSSLFLAFDDDSALEIIGEDTYESFTIYANGNQVVV